MCEQALIIDSHVHLDNIRRKNPDRIAWMRDRHIIPISWAFADAIASVADLRNYLREQADFIEQMNREGLKCFFLSGVHPRNIPPDLKPEAVKDLVAPFLEKRYCLGIGEIGLETGSQREKEILAAHLDLGKTVKEMGKRIGIHTPRNNKEEMTGELLSLLAGWPEIREITVVDHCTPETTGHVLKAGLRAGVTLSAIKTTLTELGQIVRAHSGDVSRIMCNTDSGTVFYEDIGELAVSDEFPPEIRRRLTFGSANEFFSVSSYQ
ncbi:hypothetical protein DENIS_0938 [Desulfonema ishimotonii]|uniref:Hydrolase TatD n=1 Tax=Desulfonema ishimotonii TaxID=45657 RepID=A0A401FSR3_9BACT|nr:TatD family hydrolase [Desulfonema ishimotonii]GBC59996.1 hypothetical protein DENIS_0938 [Desulfonema ishimotonii]